MRTRDKARVDRDTLERLPNPRIDHIMRSQALITLEARVIARGQSDHYPVTALFQVELADAKLSRQRIEAAQLAWRGARSPGRSSTRGRGCERRAGIGPVGWRRRRRTE